MIHCPATGESKAAEPRISAPLKIGLGRSDVGLHEIRDPYDRAKGSCRAGEDGILGRFDGFRRADMHPDAIEAQAAKPLGFRRLVEQW